METYVYVLVDYSFYGDYVRTELLSSLSDVLDVLYKEIDVYNYNDWGEDDTGNIKQQREAVHKELIEKLELHDEYATIDSAYNEDRDRDRDQPFRCYKGSSKIYIKRYRVYAQIGTDCSFQD